MTDDPNYIPYFSDIEDTFTRLREKSFLLSPLDWTLIESWKECGIPLRVVLRSIEEVFKNHKSGARRRAINSLRYCQSEVEAQFEEWLQTRVGAHEPSGDGSQESGVGEERNPFAKDAIVNYLRARRD